MTPERLRELIAGGETFTVEFKGEGRRALSDHDLVESVICLANGKGGLLLVGVEDDGRVTGARPHGGARTIDVLRVQALIANHTRPSLSCRAGIVEEGGKPVLVIEVPDSATPVGTTDGKYLRRAVLGTGKPGCVPLHFYEIRAMQADRGQLDYSALVVPDASWDDLDPLEFERFRRTVRESRGAADRVLLELPDVELAKALGAVELDGEVVKIRTLGLLLFGREESLARSIPTHEVAFQVLAGTHVEVNEFLRWPLLRAVDEVLSRFRARNREQEVMVGLLRVGVPDYPEAAFREALANALIHRDYTRLGAAHIQWRTDELEISNPGGFPEGVSIDNLLVTPPRPRNPLLADAFKRAGIVERTARGIDTIFYEQLRNGRPAPSYQRSTETSVVLTLPGGQANLDFVRLVTEEAQAERMLRLDELLILNHLWRERRADAATVSRVIQKPESDARAALERLVEFGLAEPRGERKGRTYHLSAGTYRRLGDKAAYVRTRGFEPLQQEQMVLQYVQSHGRITRSEVQGLCRLGPNQAFRLLARLTREGKLLKHGERKATWYGPRA